MIIRTSLVGLVIAAAVGIAACGTNNGISQDEADKLQKQSTELQEKAQTTADDIRSGKVDAEEAAKDSDIPDDVKKQLEDAQKQLDAAAGGGS